MTAMHASTKQGLCFVQAPPLALRSVLEGEIRAFASQQGVDGHRQCMRKFLELLLARGGQFCGRSKLWTCNPFAASLCQPTVCWEYWMNKGAQQGRACIRACHKCTVHACMQAC